METDSVRLELLRPDQVAAQWARAPIAYVPIGCIEYHGPHLPLGVDGLTAHAVCTHAALASGGVVHPVSYQANGCLDLPYTLTYPPSVVEAWACTVIEEFHRRGAELVVLLTGHGPLDLIHLLKRVCASYESPGRRAYGLCYLELSAARLNEPELGEPTVIDHASTIETSWILAHHPDLVDLESLPDDEDAQIVGVYGKNPRITATAELGRTQREAAAELLARRCRAMLNGEWRDDMDDLRRFVDFVWPEDLEIDGESTEPGQSRIVIKNPGRASRYITAIRDLVIDGERVELREATISNNCLGEVGVPFRVGALHAENGIYVRRGQSLDLLIPGWVTGNRPEHVLLTVELAGVRTAELEWSSTHCHESVSVLDGEAEAP